MGISKSRALHVSFSRSSLCYTAGEQITGLISFHNTRKKFILNGVFLELIGELGYTTQKTDYIYDGLDSSHLEYRTVYHQISFLTIRHPIIYPKDNQSGITLYRGQYSWPFELVLPQSLQPSTSPSNTSYPYIKYYARIIIDKPWYKSNPKQIYPLIIFPSVDIFNVNDERQSIALSRRNRKNLGIKVYLYNRRILPGQKISLDIDIENPKRLQIQNIQATLIQHRIIAQNHHAEIIFRMDLSNLSNFNQTELHRTFDLQVPYGRLSPTYNYTVQSSNLIISTDICYELELKVNVRGMLTEMKISIPIIIGTDSSLERYQQQRNSAETEMPIAYEDTHLPPSYESLLQSF